MFLIHQFLRSNQRQNCSYVASTLALGCLLTGILQAQAIDPSHRPIAEIQIKGLKEVSEQLVRNQIRSRPGDPYDPTVVSKDIINITHLGQFNSVVPTVRSLEDGSVILIFEVDEQPILADVQVVGNKAISDQELLRQILLRSGDAANPFLIERGVRQIKDAYQKKGFFEVRSEVDEQLLADTSILVYSIVEGPRVKIKDIRFEGNRSFTPNQISSRIRSKVHFPLLRQGPLSRAELDLDEARVRSFYRDRGFLDAQVYTRTQVSPDDKDAVVTFVIEEGSSYLIRDLRIEGNAVFPAEQVKHVLRLASGDMYSETKIQQSQQAILDLYGKLGYVETQATVDRIFFEDYAQVDLLIRIEEGVASQVGTITVRGNELTKNKVILRQIRGMTPGRIFDRSGIEDTHRRLNESPLFSEGTVTLLGDSDEEVRDVLIEVKEANTGSVLFGAGVSSDFGLLGAIDLTQRNFDIADSPESFKELVTGKAFRGAGQFFSINIQPGNENSRYSINFKEPYVFETNYFFDSSLFFFESEREDWDEGRLGGSVGVGQRFGDIWSGSVRLRINNVDIRDLHPDAPLDAFAVGGDNSVTGVGFVVERNTTDSFIFPTQGSKTEFGLEQVGALGGDFDFTRVRGEFRQFWTVDEDFFGRRTVLSARAQLGYIFEDDEAPLFERFYAGGQRTFRGFEFRGVGPRGIRADTLMVDDDPVGGDWLFLTSLEYNFPIHQEVLRGVFFTDMGTVQDDIGFDEWRISIGTGLRIQVPFLGQAPFAMDLALPVMKKDGDQEQLFSFSLALPFR